MNNANPVETLKQKDSPDFIWTHVKSASGYKRIYWIPYLVEIKDKSAGIWLVKYHGGEIELDLNIVDSLMFYGKDGAISIEFLGECAKHKILILMHRRTSKDVGIFYNGNTSSTTINLVKQILARENKIKACYIAKVLVREQIQQRQVYFKELGENGFFMSSSFFKRLAAVKTVDEVRVLESQAALRFWNMFFAKTQELLKTSGVAEGNPLVSFKEDHSTHSNFVQTRRGAGPIQDALNACSVFLTGIVLRWVLLHRLSPAHGYLHVNSGYEGLVFDLVEPFRWLIEKAVLDAIKTNGLNYLVSRAIDNLKFELEKTVYINTGQYAQNKTAIHGIVLSLVAYLKGSSPRFVVPVQSTPSKKLRKPLFRLPGPPSSPRIKTKRIKSK